MSQFDKVAISGCERGGGGGRSFGTKREGWEEGWTLGMDSVGGGWRESNNRAVIRSEFSKWGHDRIT